MFMNAATWTLLTKLGFDTADNEAVGLARLD